MKTTIEDLQPLFSAYRLERRIAAGKTGEVYRAHHKTLDRAVAIKILPRELSDDTSFRELFTAKAKAMARLNHPNLLGVYDFGDVEGQLFVVMESVEGHSLQDAAGDGPIDPAVVVELVAGICRGLSHAHEYGIVYRDLEPSNILLDAKLVPKIGDFGLARAIGKRQGDLAAALSGPGYAAPEISGRAGADHRADLFSVGAILFRLLTGREPRVLPFPAPSSLCGSPLLLDRIVAKATHFEPEKRFRDADEIARELDLASTRMPAVVRPTRPTRPAPAPVSASTPAPSSAPAAPPAQRVSAKRRHPSLNAVFAGAVLCALGIAAALFVSNRQEDQRRKDPGASPTSPLIKASTNFQKREDAVKPAAPAKPKEPVHRALARLKAQLASGSRDEFPEGTVTREGKAYLLVDLKMGWEEAEDFAEAHGAHLAVLPGVALQNWFREHSYFDRPIWVGAGKSANDRWQWIDGSAWSEADRIHKSLDDQQFLALSRIGGLFPSRGQEEMQFAIVWHADGANPGTKENQLRRFAAAVEAGGAGEAVYPVGTRSYQGSHFYYHEKELSWDDARKFANTLGAYLAAPSGAEEQAWIATGFAARIGDDRACWLGGFLLNPTDRWQWLSRESWNNSGWAEKEPGADPSFNRLVLAPGKSADQRLVWSARDGARGTAEGMLLEWSPPTTPVSVNKFEVTSWLKGVHQKMGNQVGSTLGEFNKEHAALLRDYYRSMRRIARKEEKEPSRGRGRPERGPGGFRWPGFQSRIVEEIEDRLGRTEDAGVLMSSLPSGAPQAFADQHTESEKALRLLEDAYDLKVAAHCEFFINGILQKAKELRETGFLHGATELATRADSVRENNSAFLALLFAGTPREELPWTPRTKFDVAVPEE